MLNNIQYNWFSALNGLLLAQIKELKVKMTSSKRRTWKKPQQVHHPAADFLNCVCDAFTINNCPNPDEAAERESLQI
jgi:hypothetical protein